MTHNWTHNKMAKELGYDEFDSANHPITLTQQLGMLWYMISDAEVIQDLYTNKNNFIDKMGDSEVIFQDLLGKSFLFSQGDDLWKAKRKACSHAFYKDKLVVMLEVLKD
jgi:hypothetical protein